MYISKDRGLYSRCEDYILVRIEVYILGVKNIHILVRIEIYILGVKILY